MSREEWYVYTPYPLCWKVPNITSLLPLKSGGVGLNTALDLRIASYVANVEEVNSGVMLAFPGATYLSSNFLESVNENTVFTSDEIKTYVLNYLNQKQSIINTINLLGESGDIDVEETMFHSSSDINMSLFRFQ